MIDISIRKTKPQEVEMLQKISKNTFLETFGAQNSAENMQSYLENNLSTKKLLQELLAPQSDFYFALHEETVVGYLKLNNGDAQTEKQLKNSVEIERIYVAQTYQGKSVGAALFQQALQYAKERKAAYIWLGVWEKNEKAIRFYEKNGFLAFDKHVFQLGDDAQTDIMMRLAL